MIYFDNAATTFPKPRSVHVAVNQAMQLYGANPGRSGHNMALKTAEQIYLCREKAAQLFSCQPEQVVFTKNCTEALNIAIKGIMSQGDHIIISDLEHNSVARVAERLRQDGIADYDVATTYENDEQTVLSFEQLIRPNTKLIACTQGSNVFGMRLPTEKIGALAHQRGVKMLVDAAQTAGLIDINLRRDPIDYLCLPGHKGLYGPSGTGLLIINCDELPKPLMEGGTGSASMTLEMPDFLPDRLESGTVNTAGIIGLRAGIDFVLKRGTKELYQQELYLTDKIFQNLRNIPGVTIYGAMPKMGKTLPVISLNVYGLDGMELAERLNNYGFGVRGGFHCAKLAHTKMRTEEIGTARMSLGCFNTSEQAQLFCRTVYRISAEQVGRCKR